MRRKTIVWLSVITATIVAAVVFVSFILIDRSDIEVTVLNLGPDTLEDVVVGTEQASYPVGDIRAGKSAVIGIEVLGDSSLSVRHAGHPEWQTTNTYMTRGFVGRMAVVLEEGELIGFTEDLRIYP